MANDKTTKYLAKGGTFTGLKTGVHLTKGGFSTWLKYSSLANQSKAGFLPV